MSRKLRLIYCFGIISICVLFSCTNPFAPGKKDNDTAVTLLGDQTTIEGVFQNFRYAYMFKDTLVYGNLLANDFIFIYRNYEKGVDYSWGRAEDMLTTSGLFNTAQSLELVWNDAITPIGDSLLIDISRGFNLTIYFRADDIVKLYGRANLRLTRNHTSEIWKITQWRDESNY